MEPTPNKPPQARGSRTSRLPLVVCSAAVVVIALAVTLVLTVSVDRAPASAESSMENTEIASLAKLDMARTDLAGAYALPLDSG
ncbi:MAG: hypothetical protein ABIF77_09090, partial [bacterium]